MNKFAKGWKFYNPNHKEEQEKETAEVADDLGGYCYPNSMLEPYDVWREAQLTN